MAMRCAEKDVLTARLESNVEVDRGVNERVSQFGGTAFQVCLTRRSSPRWRKKHCEVGDGRGSEDREDRVLVGVHEYRVTGV